MMEDLNLYALLGIPFGIIFILNGVWDKSPFVIPYFKRLQEQRLGKEMMTIRMVLTGVVIIIMSLMAFVKAI